MDMLEYAHYFEILKIYTMIEDYLIQLIKKYLSISIKYNIDNQTYK